MMIATGRAGLPKIELTADRLLLVEGKDEVNLLGRLIKDCLKDDGQGIQILDVGSKDNFRPNLRGIKVAAQARPTLRSIGIIRDADDNPNGSFDSVCDSLRSAGYEPPVAHAEFSDATPSIGVFIVPDGSQSGAIETLCRRSVQDEDAAKCVDDYMECLTTHNALQSKNADKTFTHAYLAAMEDPVARVGEGAQQGVWDFQSPAFGALSQFVRDLSSLG
ncbi:MAG: hypothetical protein F4Z30_13130 [Gemmatimonadetes bacterium]|nr:hypothetical protein [Gemmatimonadota bacterium]